MREETDRRMIRPRPSHLSFSDTLYVMTDFFRLTYESNKSFIEFFFDSGLSVFF